MGIALQSYILLINEIFEIQKSIRVRYVLY